MEIRVYRQNSDNQTKEYHRRVSLTSEIHEIYKWWIRELNIKSRSIDSTWIKREKENWDMAPD